MQRLLPRYLLALIVLLSLAACGTPAQSTAQPSTPAASPSVTAGGQTGGSPKLAADAVILTIRTEGGFCVAGQCGSEKQIRANGAYRATNGSGAQKDGTLDQATAAELVQLIAAADFDQIRAQPFTGTCPIAADGQKFIYTFETLSGPQTIDSCEVEIDESSPLFKHITTIIERIDQA